MRQGWVSAGRRPSEPRPLADEPTRPRLTNPLNPSPAQPLRIGSGPIPGHFFQRTSLPPLSLSRGGALRKRCISGSRSSAGSGSPRVPLCGQAMPLSHDGDFTTPVPGSPSTVSAGHSLASAGEAGGFSPADPVAQCKGPEAGARALTGAHALFSALDSLLTLSALRRHVSQLKHQLKPGGG